MAALLVLVNGSHPDNHHRLGLHPLDKDPFMLSDGVALVLIFVNYSVVCTAIALFGIASNTVNILVFLKQGFRDTVNISLFTLAVADMASLVFLIWVGVCFNPMLHQVQDLPFEPAEIVYLTGGQPRIYFTRVAGWITSLVAVERCVCVMQPLRVKLIFTKNRLWSLQAVIFLVAFATMVPVYYTSHLGWKVDATSNRTFVGMVYMENRHTIDIITFALGVGVSMSAFVIVSACTTLLGIVLIRQSRWRAKSMSDAQTGSKQPSSTAGNPSDKSSKSKKSGGDGGSGGGGGGGKVEASSRDTQIVKTVTLIAAIFVISFLPNAASQALMSIVPDYNFAAKYENLFLVNWSFAQMAEATSSSVNIFVYYKTSTKYKETFSKLI